MMTRTTWTLAFFFVTLLTLPVGAAAPDVRDPHIRWSAQTRALAAVLHDW